MEDQVLAEQAEIVFMDLLESMTVDVASEAHRAVHLGLDPRLNIDEEEEYHLSAQARSSTGDFNTNLSKKSKHGMVDIFGQTHPAVANEVLECMSCKRKIMAGRFAPHLEKCMGKGSRARTKANRKIKIDVQDKAQRIQKAAKRIPGRTSAKLGVSNMHNANENGPNLHEQVSDDQEINRATKKTAKKVQKKSFRKLSRRSAKKP
ncbi:hypothetical protein L7F22_025112 [Adiantum nelumboides]|nr:hypothetical protein [Adiantum nelumboides]